MYLIDGSNLAGRLTGDPKNRKDVFSAVMNWARNRKNTVHLFFDGPPDEFFTRPHTSYGKVNVQLISGHPADRAILKKIQIKPESCIVVTDDRNLTDRVKQRRGRTLRLDEFIRRMDL